MPRPSRSLLFVVALTTVGPACGARKSAWDRALADTGCHADDLILKKGDPGQWVAIGCGEERVYDCDSARHGGSEDCVAVGAATDVAGDPTAEPVSAEPPAADEPAAEPAEAEPTEPASDEAVDEAAADEASADEASADDAADEPPADEADTPDDAAAE